MMDAPDNRPPGSASGEAPDQIAVIHPCLNQVRAACTNPTCQLHHQKRVGRGASHSQGSNAKSKCEDPIANPSRTAERDHLVLEPGSICLAQKFEEHRFCPTRCKTGDDMDDATALLAHFDPLPR